MNVDPRSNEPLSPPSARSRVRQRAPRGAYDRETIHAILDEGLVCHVGFAVEGQPYVIPTAYGRIDDRLFLHGSTAARLLRTLRGGVPLCVTVTLLDGLVLARSAFHHSMNYRSVVILGTATEITERAEKLRALTAIVEHVIPERMRVARPPSESELAATSVLALPIVEASAKIRSGPPLEAETDLTLPCWGGELPLRLTAMAPVADAHVAPGTEPPASLLAYRRERR